jgi:hypothetical protein
MSEIESQVQLENMPVTEEGYKSEERFWGKVTVLD